MGSVVELRKDPRGTGECASPWGGRRVDMGREPAADWNESGALLPAGAPCLPVRAGPQVGEREFPAFGNWLRVGEVVDAIATRLTRQLAGEVESSANVSSPTVFCPR